MRGCYVWIEGVGPFAGQLISRPRGKYTLLVSNVCLPHPRLEAAQRFIVQTEDAEITIKAQTREIELVRATDPYLSRIAIEGEEAAEAATDA